MRLSEYEKQVIKEAFALYLPEAEVFLFGSRVDETKKGGDIDLLVNLNSNPKLETKAMIKNYIFDKIGEQKIDIIYNHQKNIFTELLESGTIIDVLNRAEKRGLITDAKSFVAIRELRNIIAHEYLPEALLEIFKDVLEYSPILIQACHKAKSYN